MLCSDATVNITLLQRVTRKLLFANDKKRYYQKATDIDQLATSFFSQIELVYLTNSYEGLVSIRSICSSVMSLKLSRVKYSYILPSLDLFTREVQSVRHQAGRAMAREMPD